jgi:hypothetical protein
MQSGTKRVTTAFFIFMAIVMGSSVILPLFSNTAQQQVIQPTATPPPTIPAPPNVEAISFDQTYLHPSGLFTIAQPEGWTVENPTTNPSRAQVIMRNPEALSIIEAYIEQPPTPVTNLDELDAYFTSDVLRQGWSNYRNPRERARRREDDKLLIDFDLQVQDQNYVARHEAWTDGKWIYVVRVVMPDNAAQQLVEIMDQETASLQPVAAVAASPFGWNAYFDSLVKHIVRYPATWFVEDSAPGKPASIVGNNSQAVLRVESVNGETVSDESAAQAWVETNRPGAEILSVESVTRGDGDGFAVSYGFADVDGEQRSGLAILLNGPDETLHVANLRFLGDAVDLNSDEAAAANPDFAEVMNSFTVLSSLDIAPEATAEPIDPNQEIPLDFQMPQ